jgi:hypothetical protein
MVRLRFLFVYLVRTIVGPVNEVWVHSPNHRLYPLSVEQSAVAG